MMISEFGLMTASKQVSWPLWVMLATIMPMAALWLVNAVMRVRAVVKQQVAAATIKYADASSLPNTLQLLTNSYNNQFQQPLLLLLLLQLIWLLQLDSPLWQIASWLFVLGRYWHTFEHLHGRNLLRRTIAFSLSSMLLFTMWLVFLLSQLLG